MENSNKNIDDLFRAELGNYAETPPPAVWDHLEKRLSGVPPVTPPGLWWPRYFIIISALFVLGFSVTKAVSGALYTYAKNTGTAAGIAASAINSNKTTSQPASRRPHLLSDNSATTQQRDGNNLSTEPGAKRSAESQMNPVKKPLLSSNASPFLNAGSKAHTTIGAKNNGSNPADAYTHGTTKQNLRHGRNGAPGNKTVINKKQKSNLHKLMHFASSIAHTKNSLNPGKGKAPVSAFNNESDPADNTADEIMPQSKPGSVNSQPQATAAEKEQAPEAEKKIKKEELPAVKAAVAAATAPIPKSKMLEAGLKAGYESGLNNSGARITVISPYISYKLPGKLSVMIMPAIKYASVSSRNLTGKESFYKENNDSTATLNKIPIYEGILLGHMESITYTQSHDTVVKSYSTNGKYRELELPVLLKYAITKNLAAYGGFTLSYSSYVGFTEHTFTGAPVYDTFTSKNTIVLQNHPDLVAAPVNSQIVYSGNPISSYKGPLYAPPAKGLLRMGYMMGFNYQYNRILLDMLIQQSSVKTDVQGGYNTNAPFSAPYFRITLGYRVF